MAIFQELGFVFLVRFSSQLLFRKSRACLLDSRWKMVDLFNARKMIKKLSVSVGRVIFPHSVAPFFIMEKRKLSRLWRALHEMYYV